MVYPASQRMVSEEEVRQLSNRHKTGEPLPDMVVQLLLEAEEHGGVLDRSNLAVMTHCSIATVIGAGEHGRQKKEKTAHETHLALHDTVTTFTHKKQILELYLQDFTSEFARMTDHGTVDVDCYIGDFQRIFLQALMKQPLNTICFYAGLSKGLMTQ